MQALKQAGSDENTLTFFTSDNGAPTDHASPQNAYVTYSGRTAHTVHRHPNARVLKCTDDGLATPLLVYSSRPCPPPLSLDEATTSYFSSQDDRVRCRRCLRSHVCADCRVVANATLMGGIVGSGPMHLWPASKDRSLRVGYECLQWHGGRVRALTRLQPTPAVRCFIDL